MSLPVGPGGTGGSPSSLWRRLPAPLRWLLHATALLFVLALGTFALADWAPGDFLSEMRLDGSLSQETLDHLRSRYGLDAPWPVRFGRWLGSVARGEMGWSFGHNMAVGPLVWPRLLNTLTLGAVALVACWALALALGTAAARRAGGWLDRLVVGSSSLPLAIPELVVALGALLLAVETGWFPTGGTVSYDHESLGFWARLGDRLHHLALPAAVLVVSTLPALVRHVRSAMVGALATPPVQAARGHGVPESRILLRYALPLAAHPLVSLLGLTLAQMLSGSVLIEVVMSWPGIGALLLDAVLARDLHVVASVVLLAAVCMLLGNGLADALLWWLDPRLRDGVTEEA